MAVRFKQIETRSWPTHYRGPIAIHAAARWTRNERMTTCEIPFAQALFEGGYLATTHTDEPWVTDRRVLPLGAVIGVGELVSCRQVAYGEQDPPPVGTYERAFGNYGEGYWMWWIKDIRMFVEPIPAKGMQGLWNWQPPEGALDTLQEPLALRAMEPVAIRRVA